MPLSSTLRRFPLPFLLSAILFAAPCLAQQNGNIPFPETIPAPPSQLPAEAQANKGPALMDPAGPTVSLQTSEAMFYVGVALNACGYDDGLDESAPVRRTVRDEVNQATQASEQARDDRDKLCLYIDQHRLSDPAQNLAQYVSLALYLTPPPDLTPSVDEQDLPPDANGVLLILPMLRRFASDIQLHVIWLENRAAYDDLVSQLHAPLTNMIVSTNYYLKMPATTGFGRRFLVVLEPMFSPEETNARVYGSDYVVVASPKNGQIYMRLVRHAYLHYEIEPLLYARANAIDRLEPILKAVQFAPLQFNFKNDIDALVIECLIHAVEARTMDTGVKIVQVPANLPRSETEPYEEARRVSIEKDEAVRQQSVDHSMAQGYVLTQYFYNQLIQFEKSPESLDSAIGPMVYGMDVDSEVHRARNVAFDQTGEGDLLSRAPQQPQDLDLAEMKLMKGDVAGAQQLAQKALDAHTGDPGRAEFILARADLMSNNVDGATAAFHKTLADSRDPRLLAWSHIYLGRIFDVEDQRDEAVAEYKAALTSRDGQPDTREAAESGLKQPFTLPQPASDTNPPSKSAPPAQTNPH